MKQLIKLASMLLAVMLMLCACNVNEQEDTTVTTNEGINEVGENFSDLMSLDDIISDTKNIDLYYTPDLDGLTKQTEKDDESATAVTYYYDGKTLVYAFYEGYGEECFDYYTTSKQGRSLTVKYVDEGSERYSVDVACRDYSISFSELDKKAKYGAKYITASAEETAKNDFSRSVTYTCENGEEYISQGFYYAEDGYHRYSAYPSENNKIDSEDTLIYKKADSVNVNESLPSLLKDYRVKNGELLLGTHTLEYTQSSGGEKLWYVVADVYAVFDDRFKALEYSEKYGIDVQKSETDEDYWVAEFKSTALPVSDSFDDFFGFAQQEINDYYYCVLVFDDDGRLKDLDPSSARLTYY
ncbi:MAG: hypothetical protein ACI4RR_08925 [Eubacterium sp.]